MRLLATLLTLLLTMPFTWANSNDSTVLNVAVAAAHPSVALSQGVQLEWLEASPVQIGMMAPLPVGATQHLWMEELYPGADLEIITFAGDSVQYTLHIASEAELSDISLSVNGAVWVAWSNAWQLRSGTGAFNWEITQTNGLEDGVEWIHRGNQVYLHAPAILRTEAAEVSWVQRRL